MIDLCDHIIEELEVSSSGKFLCVGSRGGELISYEIDKPESATMLLSRPGAIRGIAFHPYRHKLVAVDASGRLTKWDLDQPSKAQSEAKLSGALHCIDWSPDGSLVAIGGAEPVVRLLDPATNEFLIESDLDGRFNAIAWSPSGKRIAAARGDGKIVIFGRDLDVQKTFNIKTGFVNELRWNQSGSQIIATCSDHVARVVDAESGVLVTTFRGHNDYLAALSCGPDNRRIVSADARGNVKIWDAQTGSEMLALFAAVGEVRAVRWHHARQTIAVSVDGRVILWNATKGYEE